MCKALKILAFGVFSWTLGTTAHASAPSPSRPEALAFLTGLKNQNTVRLRETDEAITKKLDESHDTHQLAAVTDQIEKLRGELRELRLRQDFLDRLTTKVDAHYGGDHMKEFLQGTLQSMAKVEIESSNEHNMWKFLNNLSLLIQAAPERSDHVLSLIEGYMKQTSIENPIRPDEYLAGMAYTNGSQTEAAHPMDRSQVGDYTDKRLREIKVQESHAKAPSHP